MAGSVEKTVKIWPFGHNAGFWIYFLAPLHFFHFFGEGVDFVQTAENSWKQLKSAYCNQWTINFNPCQTVIYSLSWGTSKAPTSSCGHGLNQQVIYPVWCVLISHLSHNNLSYSLIHVDCWYMNTNAMTWVTNLFVTHFFILNS